MVGNLNCFTNFGILFKANETIQDKIDILTNIIYIKKHNITHHFLHYVLFPGDRNYLPYINKHL